MFDTNIERTEFCNCCKTEVTIKPKDCYIVFGYEYTYGTSCPNCKARMLFSAPTYRTYPDRGPFWNAVVIEHMRKKEKEKKEELERTKFW